MTWVGIDDTDSRSGGCTTYVAFRLAREAGLDLIGLPRLVRLDPSVPWKTRGNGAVCLRLGRGRGAPRRIGSADGRPVLGYPSGKPAEPGDLLDRLWSLADAMDGGFQPGANPAIVVAERPPPPSFYWKAVRQVVAVEAYARWAAERAVFRTRNGRRGIVGAVAATAWRPRDRTYEAIAYRHPHAWGTTRRLDPRSVRRLDEVFPRTFNNYDWWRGRVALAPHSPCPVLCGVRGEDPATVARGLLTLRGERAQGWMTFETNQGTDDHVGRGRPAPRTALAVTGRVLAAPREIPGGHVAVRLQAAWPLDCVAYEPTKQFRAVVRALAAGDRVTAVGSIRARPRALNLEKLLVRELEAVRRKVANPVCACGRRMGSRGRGLGFRCRACGRLAPPSAATFAFVPRRIQPGWYEPPVSARRHLSKPLKRMGLGESWGPQAVMDRISIPAGSTK